uniref:Glycosyltransferase 2-like domain-containing protein n=1 Tax=Sus scrofa TaxID=9823 RepID=A0A8D1CKW1_PIG
MVSFAVPRCLSILKMSMVLLVLSVGLFMFRSVFLDTDFSLLNSPIPSPTLDAQTLKLLPEKHDFGGLFPKNQCQCDAFGHQGSYNLEDAYDPQDLPAVNLRRQAELEHFQRREGLPRPPPLLAQPNLPFGYPVHGVEVMPLHTIPIPGLRFEGPDAPIYEVTLTASLGTLNTLADVPDNVVKGRGQKQLNILTSSRELLNFILQHVTYTSTEYHLHRVDVVRILEDRALTPTLSCPERKLRDLVTIATKTFLRPHKLMTMLRSVREYYPDLTVIVADDSKEPLKITDSHVEYYAMPFGKGWFAGRNLAISQVTTKYVLWVDDDFIFNSKTRIEALVDVLEKTELDVVSELSAASSTPLPSDESICVSRSIGPGLWFEAHVSFSRSLPLLAEFFIDGLGSLLVGSCPHVIIGHQPHLPVMDPELATLEGNYTSYRANTEAQIKFKLALHYFKNYLQCAT